MQTKRSQEGYLLIDNRVNSGVPDEFVERAGLPPGAGRGVFETPTYTCSHCTRVVMMNPQRSRARSYCQQCDHYICDTCGGALAESGICRTFKQIMDDICEAAEVTIL